jgi:hypothetical protein
VLMRTAWAMNKRILLHALLVFGCAVEDDDTDPGSIELSADDEEDDRAIPVCDADKELTRVDCNLGLTGAQATKPCQAVLAGVNPDDSIWVTAKVYEQNGCDCEWTPPGKVGTATAVCSDLNAGYETPVLDEGTCKPVIQTTGMLVAEGTGNGATYEEAEAAAFAACGVASQQRCTWLCAYMKDQGYHKKPPQKIDCCTPRAQECDGDEPCDVEAESDGGWDDASSGELPDDDAEPPEPAPVPAPE